MTDKMILRELRKIVDLLKTRTVHPDELVATKLHLAESRRQRDALARKLAAVQRK